MSEGLTKLHAATAATKLQQLQQINISMSEGLTKRVAYAAAAAGVANPLNFKGSY
jgi:hypothetical protein